MITEKKNNFPWDTMDTTILMMPEELLVYHLYRLQQERSSKKEKHIKENIFIISSYLASSQKEKEEKPTCFQK